MSVVKSVFTSYSISDNPALHQYTSRSHIDVSGELVHSQDFSHNIKKIRNSLLSSGDIAGQHTRKLQISDYPVVWQLWIDAVNWDRDTNRLNE